MKKRILGVLLLMIVSGCTQKEKQVIEQITCKGTLQDTSITTTLKAENNQIQEQSILLQSDYAAYGYSDKQMAACIKERQKEYSKIKGLQYEASVSGKKIHAEAAFRSAQCQCTGAEGYGFSNCRKYIRFRFG